MNVYFVTRKQKQMFFCNISILFWKDFHNWILHNNMAMPALTYDKTKLGLIMEDRKLDLKIYIYIIT